VNRKEEPRAKGKARSAKSKEWLCPLLFALCPSLFALRPLPFALCPLLFATKNRRITFGG
ncbi:MAG TPA: hypothetical protein VFF31_28735, partial [Blastocatellia bacterium]|nr:hypothetical protein [Blastocatellia bacterium]